MRLLLVMLPAFALVAITVAVAQSPNVQIQAPEGRIPRVTVIRLSAADTEMICVEMPSGRANCRSVKEVRAFFNAPRKD